MTFSQSFILKKLEEISGYLKEVEELFQFPEREIVKDSGKMHIAERLLQLIVDTTIDINQHFIKELDLKPTEDFQSTFYTLADNKILPKDFAFRIAPVVGLRNRIVHRYNTLDKELFIKTFKKNCSDFKKYLNLINRYLKKKNRKSKNLADEY